VTSESGQFSQYVKLKIIKMRDLLITLHPGWTKYQQT